MRTVAPHKHFGKYDVPYTVKVQAVQERQIALAARLETARTGRRVYPRVLLRERGMQGVRRILRRAGKL